MNLKNDVHNGKNVKLKKVNLTF